MIAQRGLCASTKLSSSSTTSSILRVRVVYRASIASRRGYSQSAPRHSKRPLPVVLCGKTEQVGRGVIEGLKPEYEAIRFIMTPESGRRELPLLLSRDTSTRRGIPAPASSLGTNDMELEPLAVILGGGYNDADIESMRDACYPPSSTEETERVKEREKEIRAIPWLRPDLTKPTPPLGPEYGKAMVARVKEVLAQLEKDGKLEGNGQVVWY